jgi:archaemetzincin
MKQIVKILIATCLFSTCSPIPDPGPVHTIGLQPFGHYDPQQLRFVQQQVQAFFHKRVVILDEMEIPPAYLNLSKGERYSADSIIKFLAARTDDTLTHIVGLTHKDIFTSRKDENGQLKKPSSRYAVWGIFGLGYYSGKSCVISDFRLKTNNAVRFNHRLRTVVLHELGHNLGRPHCKNSLCIMNDANEKIQTVDKSGNDYCTDCRKHITDL